MKDLIEKQAEQKLQIAGLDVIEIRDRALANFN
ncbi:hypothetical protein FHR29_001889 [Sphingobacterium sp. JUb56]|nr:hypothetical protein [Sphingobacterium sp. JUb56]